MKAVWISDYDYRTDEIYSCPGCPTCKAPAYLDKDSYKYHCPSCGEYLDLDPDMLKWKEERTGQKVVHNQMCIACGNKTSTWYYHKNHKKEWIVGHGECPCGCHFIV